MCTNLISTILLHGFAYNVLITQCPVLLVQPTRADDACLVNPARGLISQEHLVLENTASVMDHPSMIFVLAYVSLISVVYWKW